MQIASPTLFRERTPFIGRKRERRELAAELGRGANLLSLVGPSGIGKTRLARQVASEVAHSYGLDGGVWFANLAGCQTAEEVEIATSRALELRELQGDELASAIASRGPLLLLLDNADTVAARMAPILERWLDRCVELQVLLTSLVPTRARGEWVFELLPLSQEDAIALYRDRAHRAWADRSFSEEEESKIQELVQRLDGHPLAIELAAARIRVLPPRAMLSMLEKRFEVLQLSRNGAAPGDPASLGPPRRNRSLLGAIEITWSHLSPAEQVALARAAVFEDGFDAAAFLAVVGPDVGEAAELQTRGLLDELCGKSLIFHEGRRYSLLESVKEYSLRELKRMGLWEETTRRHAAHYLGQEEARTEWIEERESAGALPWLKRERANLIAIHHRFFSDDPPLAARAGISLVPLIRWEGQTDPEKGLPWSIRDAAERSGDPKLLAMALHFVATCHFQLGNLERAAGVYEASVQIARDAADTILEAKGLANLAAVHLRLGDLRKSRGLIERADELCAGVDLPSIQGYVRQAQGLEALLSGDLEEAEARNRQALSLLEVRGRLGSRADVCYYLGLTLANQRKFSEALPLLETALEACRAIDYRGLEAYLMGHKALVELAAGRTDDAEASCRRSLEIHKQIGNGFRMGEGFFTLGVIALERGDPDRAESWLGRAREQFEARGAAEYLIEVEVFLAILESMRGRAEEARAILEEVQASVRTQLQPTSPLAAAPIQMLLNLALAQLAKASNPEQARAHVETVRAYLADAGSLELRLPSLLPIYPRLLAKLLAAWDQDASLVAEAPTKATLHVGEHWFHLEGEERVDLRSRRVLRGIFARLLERRLEAPGEAVSPNELIAAGWPRAAPAAISTDRLYFAIWALRDLGGLRAIVQKEEGGYLLDPDTPIISA